MPSRDDDLKALCDETVELAVERMHHAGAPAPMILDRLLTYAAAQACTRNGSEFTAEVFREIADKIKGGIFRRIAGEAPFEEFLETRKKH